MRKYIAAGNNVIIAISLDTYIDVCSDAGIAQLMTVLLDMSPYVYGCLVIRATLLLWCHTIFPNRPTKAQMPPADNKLTLKIHLPR